MERDSLAVREQAALDSLMERQKNGGGIYGGLVKSKTYLENPDFKQFNSQLREHSFKKLRTPQKLGTVEETFDEIQSYFDMCDKYSQLPSIKSLCLYLGISISTMSAYINEPDSPYGELFNAARDYCHSLIENGAMNNKINPATYMFTASNFYGMKDSRSIEITPVNPANNVSRGSKESLDALKKLLEDEKKEKMSEGAIEAEFIEK